MISGFERSTVSLFSWDARQHRKKDKTQDGKRVPPYCSCNHIVQQDGVNRKPVFRPCSTWIPSDSIRGMPGRCRNMTSRTAKTGQGQGPLWRSRLDERYEGSASPSVSCRRFQRTATKPSKLAKRLHPGIWETSQLPGLTYGDGHWTRQP